MAAVAELGSLGPQPGMATCIRTIDSLADELLAKSKESALCAIRVFNDPHVSFKSETFIVLMNIAWTYLLHAYYRKKGVSTATSGERGAPEV